MLPVKQWFHTQAALMGASTNTKKASNPAIEAGIRYHRRIYKTLRLNVNLLWPGWDLLVEPWFHTAGKADLCSPDAVLRHQDLGIAVVIEVKKNWKDGRDKKLLDLYLPVVRSAFGLKPRPLMIVGNVRGLKHEPFLSMADVTRLPLEWRPGADTPTLLVP